MGSKCLWQYLRRARSRVKHNISHRRRFICQICWMRKSLDGQLAKYLRKARGEMSYAQFAKKTGISHSMLQRLEFRERHITINKLETLMNKLKIKLSDIFPDEF